MMMIWKVTQQLWVWSSLCLIGWRTGLSHEQPQAVKSVMKKTDIITVHMRNREGGKLVKNPAIKQNLVGYKMQQLTTLVKRNNTIQLQKLDGWRTENGAGFRLTGWLQMYVDIYIYHIYIYTPKRSLIYLPWHSLTKALPSKVKVWINIEMLYCTYTRMQYIYIYIYIAIYWFIDTCMFVLFNM